MATDNLARKLEKILIHGYPLNTTKNTRTIKIERIGKFEYPLNTTTVNLAIMVERMENMVIYYIRPRITLL